MLESSGVTENFFVARPEVSGLKSDDALLLSKFSLRGEKRLSLEMCLLVMAAPERSLRGENILSVESLEGTACAKFFSLPIF